MSGGRKKLQKMIYCLEPIQNVYCVIWDLQKHLKEFPLRKKWGRDGRGGQGMQGLEGPKPNFCKGPKYRVTLLIVRSPKFRNSENRLRGQQWLHYIFIFRTDRPVGLQKSWLNLGTISSGVVPLVPLNMFVCSVVSVMDVQLRRLFDRQYGDSLHNDYWNAFVCMFCVMTLTLKCVYTRTFM